MASATPFHSGKVDWCGDNPGIYLRESADGPYVTLAVYFRIVISPHGGGNAMLLLESPTSAASLPEACNVMVGNNAALTRYLFDNFCRKFGAFSTLPAMDVVQFLTLESVSERGDGNAGYSVELKGGGHSFRLVWEDLGTPFAADVPPQRSATGHHEMYSCFVEARDARIEVDGRRLAGRPFPRDFQGRPTSSAFLAFAETWVLGA